MEVPRGLLSTMEQHLPAHPRHLKHHAHDFIGGMASASASWHLAARH